jgi:hypothetical protein
MRRVASIHNRARIVIVYFSNMRLQKWSAH